MDVRHGAETSHLSLDHVPLRLFSTCAMLVIISPLTGGEWQLFPRLRARGNEGLLISPDPVGARHLRGLVRRATQPVWLHQG